MYFWSPIFNMDEHLFRNRPLNLSNLVILHGVADMK